MTLTGDHDKGSTGAGVSARNQGEIKMSTMVNPSLSPITTRGLRWAGGTMLAAVWRFIRIRRDRRQLCELPDHILRDVGITRSEIDSITLFAWRDPSRRSRS